MTTHGSRCAELDALPPSELRRRVEEAILSHVDEEEWERLQTIEEIEKESIESYFANLGDLAEGENMT